MPYLVLGVAVVVGLFFLARGVRGANPQTVVRAAKWIGIGLGVTILLILTLRGGLMTMLLMAAAMIPIILRWRMFSRMARGWRGPQPGQSSDLETRYLRMTLDHDSGVLKGTVLEGQFKGRLLEELDQAQILSLLQECRVHDEQSAQILETYLDRIYGAEWRSGGGEQSRARDGAGASTGSGAMTREEAYSVLGLKPGASDDQIKEAHRKLMVKMHPDQGGSTYLAAKINQAKDLLLNQ